MTGRGDLHPEGWAEDSTAANDRAEARAERDRSVRSRTAERYGDDAPSRNDERGD